MAAGDRFNFWTLVDERDAARGFEKALAAPYDGSHVLFVNDSHNWLLYETERLLAFFFPEATERRRPLPGAASLVSIDRARDLIGFEPEHSVARLLARRPG
jgi:nucleoside-diphosphate-sugar epimerase